MDITRHIVKRYAERIEGIKDEAEVTKYINSNLETAKEKILRIYQDSEWIYQGQIGSDKSIANFYIKDDIVLVGDIQETRLYTLYLIDFDFPLETNRIVIKDLTKAIKQLRNDSDATQEEMDKYIEEKEYLIEGYDIQIKNLKDQIDHIEHKKKTAKNEIECERESLEMINKKIENYANKLCNSLEFKKDVLSNMIKFI